MSAILPGLWFFLLGAVMGSFYNVLTDRLPEGRDIVSRSRCSDCGSVLKTADLIPLMSFLFLKGRCRYCGAKLSPRYFLSELLTGALFLFAFLLFLRTGSIVRLIGFLYLWSLLYIVAVMDYRTGMIMDLFPLLIALGGLAFGLISGRSIAAILQGLLCGAGSFLLIYLLCRLILKREGMGLGDVFLLGGIGAWLPWQQVIVCVFLTAYVALVFIAVKAVRDKKLGLGSELPLGPSICIAAFILSVWGDRLMAFLSRILFL